MPPPRGRLSPTFRTNNKSATQSRSTQTVLTCWAPGPLGQVASRHAAGTRTSIGGPGGQQQNGGWQNQPGQANTPLTFQGLQTHQGRPGQQQPGQLRPQGWRDEAQSAPGDGLLDRLGNTVNTPLDFGGAPPIRDQPIIQPSTSPVDVPGAREATGPLQATGPVDFSGPRQASGPISFHRAARCNQSGRVSRDRIKHLAR